jgi:hypothetical protein
LSQDIKTEQDNASTERPLRQRRAAAISATESISEMTTLTTTRSGRKVVGRRVIIREDSESDLNDDDDDDDDDEHGILPTRGRPRRAKAAVTRQLAGVESISLYNAGSNHSRQRGRNNVQAGKHRRPPRPPQSQASSVDNDDAYTQSMSGDKDMVCCDRCDRWVHVACDPSLTPADYERLTKDTGAHYVCPLCDTSKLAQLMAQRPLQHGRAGHLPRLAALAEKAEKDASALAAIQSDAAPVPVRQIMIDAATRRGVVAPALHAAGHGWFDGDCRFRDMPWQPQQLSQATMMTMTAASSGALTTHT